MFNRNKDIAESDLSAIIEKSGFSVFGQEHIAVPGDYYKLLLFSS